LPPDVFLLAGTRPESIKLAPVAAALARGGRMRPVMVASGQHPAMVVQALEAFDQKPDHTLMINRQSGTQAELCGQLLSELDILLEKEKPAAVVVQGDTTTTLAGALGAFWRRIPVVHLEAGLRSYDLASPFPEEANRKLVGQIASLHLPPTFVAAANLAAEGIVGQRVLTVGNTVVDAVLEVAGRGRAFQNERLAAVQESVRAGRRLVLVTAHRRESWGEPMDRILRAVAQLVDSHPDLEVVLPAHPNPAVFAQVQSILGGVDRVTVTKPLAYQDLARLLSMSSLVLSDSGGIQEEAPSFGVPVLVLRDVTERQEAVDAGCARLVGTDRQLIVDEARRLLGDEAARLAMTAAGNPFGDGLAAERTEQALAWLIGLHADRPANFSSRKGKDVRTAENAGGSVGMTAQAVA
jgi:UDP-N-acetylglucosamine 2-epimerase (non-hydrolysing)